MDDIIKAVYRIVLLYGAKDALPKIKNIILIKSYYERRDKMMRLYDAVWAEHIQMKE